MTKVVYFHGFGSSSKTQKVSFLAEHFPDCTIVAPNIPPQADAAYAIIEALMWHLLEDNEPIILAGTSLGGFWAHLFGDRFACKSIIMNPALTPSESLKSFVDKPVPFEGYTAEGFTNEDADEYKKYQDQLTFKYYENCFRTVLLEEGDELLDSRVSYDKYADNSIATLIPGGEHRFASLGQFQEQLRSLL